MTIDLIMWLNAQPILVQNVVYLILIVIMGICLLVNYSIKKKEKIKDFKKFVYDYYNGTLDYRGGRK